MLPPRSAISTARFERFVRSLKEEALERMIFFGTRSLEKAVDQYLVHDHTEGNHGGLGNKIIQPGSEVGRDEGETQCQERLGGALRYYYRDAA